MMGKADQESVADVIKRAREMPDDDMGGGANVSNTCV